MVAAITKGEVSFKAGIFSIVSHYPAQVFLAVGIEDMVHKLYDNFGYLIIKDDCRVFKCYVHNGWGFMTCAIADAGRIIH